MPGPGSRISMLKPNISKYRLLNHIVMGPEILRKSAVLDDKVSKDDNPLVLNVSSDIASYDSLLSLKLLAGGDIPTGANDADLVVKITAILEHAKPNYDPLAIVITDGCEAEPHDNAYAIGFQIRDPSEYATLGPYLGIEGTPGATLNGGSPNIHQKAGEDQMEKLRAHVDSPTMRWPQIFDITLLPYWLWGTCSSPIAGGLSISAKYDGKPSVAQNWLTPRRSGLYLELYRGTPAETYEINSLEVQVFATSYYT